MAETITVLGKTVTFKRAIMSDDGIRVSGPVSFRMISWAAGYEVLIYVGDNRFSGGLWQKPQTSANCAMRKALAFVRKVNGALEAVNAGF